MVLIKIHIFTWKDSGGFETFIWDTAEREIVSIGRLDKGPSALHISLPDPQISRDHAEFRYVDGAVIFNLKKSISDSYYIAKTGRLFKKEGKINFTDAEREIRIHSTNFLIAIKGYYLIVYSGLEDRTNKIVEFVNSKTR